MNPPGAATGAVSLSYTGDAFMLTTGINVYTAFISGGPGGGELVLLLIIVLLLFGPRRLPSLARSIGRAMSELRRAADDFKAQLFAADNGADHANGEIKRPETEASPSSTDRNDDFAG